MPADAPRQPRNLPSVNLPSVEQLVASAHVVSLPMRVKFRGITQREALLLDGPLGWGEFCPFPEYGDAEASRWLASAVEAGWQGFPPALRSVIPVNATVPAVPADRVPDVLARFGRVDAVKIKVAERGQTLDDDAARVAAVRSALPDAAIRVDANGGWDVPAAVEALTRLSAVGLEYAEQPVPDIEGLAEVRRRLRDAGVPVLIAADESVRKEEDPLRVARAGAADLIVVKVAPLGECGAPWTSWRRPGCPPSSVPRWTPRWASAPGWPWRRRSRNCRMPAGWERFRCLSRTSPWTRWWPTTAPSASATSPPTPGCWSGTRHPPTAGTGGWTGSAASTQCCSPDLHLPDGCRLRSAGKVGWTASHPLEAPMSETTGRKFALLPMLGHTKGKRSPVTCALKCDNACSGEVCNTSSNSYFRDIASATMSRRAALGFGAAGALAVVLGSAATSAGTAVADGGTGLAAAAKDGFGKSKLQFTAIPSVAADVDKLTVPAGFTWQPVIRWGDPIFNTAPDFDLNNQTAAAQEQQFGYNNDYSDILEIPGSKGRRAVLFANHEYTNENIMFPATMPAADVRAVGQAAHGLSVVELERKNKNKPWSYVKGAGLNRRYLNSTVYELTGPAAGSSLVKTIDDPSGRAIKGTLGNCAGGTTPWGTILSGEENFNGYFVSPGTSASTSATG